MTSTDPTRETIGGLDAFARRIRHPTFAEELSWRPVFVRLDVSQAGQFADVCGRLGATAIDTLERQLRDLAVIRYPPPQAEAERARFIEEKIEEGGGVEAMGTWVYFPWLRTAVRLLDEEDYVEVVTNRNLDKITRAERAALRTKRIGVMGLSVGGEAAVTVAQEHLCGEIVLADFDRLDLSNLNRLNAGCDELGLPKTTIAARRIARIDPYMGVRVFDEGVTEANVGAFLAGLDLLIEECDDLTIKYRVRELARERRLNIVFAGDERGFLSVEPHGAEPDLPVFHGRVIETPGARDEPLPPREFLRELTEWLGGWDAISPRSRASLEQVGTTLCGYPQLAGEARFAAGGIAHVARRLLLGERVPPFLGHLDLDELIPAGVSAPVNAGGL